MRYFALIALAVVLIAGQISLGQRRPSFVKVSAAATIPDADGKQTVNVVLDVAPGFYIFANPIGFADFEDEATTVSVASLGKPATVKVRYPPGSRVEEKALQTSFMVYRGKVTIPAIVQRAPGDLSALDVRVRFRPMNGVMCAPPTTVKLVVPAGGGVPRPMESSRR